MEDLALVPLPRKLLSKSGRWQLPRRGVIALDSHEPQQLLWLAQRLQSVLASFGGIWTICAGAVADAKVRLSMWPGLNQHPQGYRINIAESGINVVASSLPGTFYGVMTLIQVLEASAQESSVPAMQIDDWPDFMHRGVMLDISRDKVPTLETLYMLIDQLASWKINQVQLYTEHTFAYRKHPLVWQDATPLTAQDILALDAFCRERCIELVPNQNTFGHLRRWLIHEPYRDLAECPDGCDTGDPVWGVFEDPFTLNPEDPRSLQLVQSMFDELLPNFASIQVNVGCDETVELGLGRSKAQVQERGKGRVYLDFLLKVYADLKRRGYSTQFWGDIIIHYPELVSELPSDMVALEWGYEFDHPFAEHSTLFANSGVPFYVCPGTSSWNSIAGRTSNALENLRQAAHHGLANGAIGYLVTDWGDYGHWQPLPVSYPGFLYGAALGWNYTSADVLDLPALLNRFVFRDRSNVLGQLVLELGDVYQLVGERLHNASHLFYILQRSPEAIREMPLSVEQLQTAHAKLSGLFEQLEHVRLDRADGELIKQEFAWAIEMLRYACERGRWFLHHSEPLPDHLCQAAEALQQEQRRIWLARNRSGGLEDSLKYWNSDG